MMRCPICGREFTMDSPGVVMPFCSKRCKAIDAKRWLNEEYFVETVNVDLLEQEIANGFDKSRENDEDRETFK